MDFLTNKQTNKERRGVKENKLAMCRGRNPKGVFLW